MRRCVGCWTVLPAPVRNRRAMICAKAIDPEHTPDAVNTLDTILIKYQYSGPLATRIAKILRGCGNNMGQVVCFQVGDERDGERMWLANASVVEKRTSLSRLERDPKGEREGTMRAKREFLRESREHTEEGELN